MRSNELRSCFQPMQRMLDAPRSRRRGSNNQGAVGYGFGNIGAFPGIAQKFWRTHSRARFAKRKLITIHDP